MAVWAVKRDDLGETNEKLIKRWKRYFNNSKVLNKVRSLKYHAKKITKRLQRNYKIVSDSYRAENKRLEFYDK
jgi:ribosome recycling factor